MIADATPPGHEVLCRQDLAQVGRDAPLCDALNLAILSCRPFQFGDFRAEHPHGQATYRAERRGRETTRISEQAAKTHPAGG